ncbi:hypothetical protein VNI00_009433 [Paramarasmius palmivorus]|uniref:DUF2335 domain-containing protein n=1 Tax=Paramarasmius palmivorus TaxID=297713 RepID=A0AAW0CNH1_9AGAR
MGLNGSRARRTFVTENEGNENTTDNGNGRLGEDTSFATRNVGNRNEVQNGNLAGVPLDSNSSVSYETKNRGDKNRVTNVAAHADSLDQVAAHVLSMATGQEYREGLQARGFLSITMVVVIAGLGLVLGRANLSLPTILVSLGGTIGVVCLVLTRLIPPTDSKTTEPPPPYPTNRKA